MKRLPFVVLVVVLSLSGLLCSPVSAAESLPEWIPGSWWEYTTVADMHLQEEGSDEYVDMVFSDNGPPNNLVEITSRTLTKGSMLTYTIYRLEFSGTGSGEGTAHITDPVTMDIPVEIRNATETGEWWVDTLTLGTVYYYRHIDGFLWAQIPFQGWQQIGTTTIDYYEEYEPPKDEMNFPIDVGNTWNETLTIYSYGHYVMDYDVGQGPQHKEDDFDEANTYTFAMDVVRMENVGGLSTYRVEGDETSSDGTLLANYAPAALNVAHEDIRDLDSSGSVRINSFVRDLGNYELVQPPTPTPTPPGGPTNTPSPTATVTVPTSTPVPPTNTPDQGCTVTGCTIEMPSSDYHPGDTCYCNVYLCNTTQETHVNTPIFVVLDVYGNYFFAPSFSETEADHYTRDVQPGRDVIEVLQVFTWPENAGSAENIIWYAAMTNQEMTELWGEMDMFTFSWHTD